MGGAGFITMQSLIISLLIAFILFGGSRLKDLGGQLGGAIKDFRKAIRDGDKAADAEHEKLETQASASKGRVIEGEVRKETDNNHSS